VVEVPEQLVDARRDRLGRQLAGEDADGLGQRVGGVDSDLRDDGGLAGVGGRPSPSAALAPKPLQVLPPLLAGSWASPGI
jgi:hypothetical protein